MCDGNNPLEDTNIFQLKPVIKNCRSKKSAFIEDINSQMKLCLVGQDNELIFRRSHKGNFHKLFDCKTVLWFKNAKKSIQDLCFDPSGSILLVLCYDNTLHTVPLNWVLDNKVIDNSGFHFSQDKISSFVIPFAGPHECPNSRKCPNNSFNTNDTNVNCSKFSTSDIQHLVTSSNSMYNAFYSALDVTKKNNLREDELSEVVDPVGNNAEENLKTCPYPTSVVWWRTFDLKQSAIIGYSDGSICMVNLAPDCPLIANTSISRGAITKMVICKDSTMNNVSLMINSSLTEQWKLLLEQKSIGYVYPCEVLSKNKNRNDVSAPEADDWQIVVPHDDDSDTEKKELKENENLVETNGNENYDATSSSSRILPATRARLVSLKDFGTKKIGALRLRLAESRTKQTEKEKFKEQLTSFTIMNVPAMLPEILTTPSGPFFIVQNIRDSFLLSALHSYNNTLSVHNMNITLVPLDIYKIPKHCRDVLVAQNFLYTVQYIPTITNETKTNSNCLTSQSKTVKYNNTIGVVSGNISSFNICEEEEFDKSSLIDHFALIDESIIDIHRVVPCTNENYKQNDGLSSSPLWSLGRNKEKLTQNYRNNLKKLSDFDDAVLHDDKMWELSFPRIDLDKCLVVTNKNVYLIELRVKPHKLFLKMAMDGQWNLCEHFCKVFNINYENCVEYAGDVFLRSHKTTQALLAYNKARIPPVKTALKLAMHSENSALMQLCAMALKNVYILKSMYPASTLISYLHSIGTLDDVDLTKNKNQLISPNHSTTNARCSDFRYKSDDPISDLQLSNSSQFHLSNLLLLTLVEKAIKDKNFLPLWNFLVTNKRYHTNMTSIVLCQSGLYSATVILACARGAHLDAYCGLVGVSNQEFGWFNELNKILTNLSEPMFAECIVYSKMVSMDYFNVIKNKITKIDMDNLKKIQKQLDPFGPVFRPIVARFISNLEETETAENQFAIMVRNNSPLSAGFSHCACIVDGVTYIWGSNGINCILNDFSRDTAEAYNSPKPLLFISNMNLEVHAVRCGRLHTLLVTNNGLYTMGSNLQGQLGVGKGILQSLQPILVYNFNGKDITLIEAGQYHNAILSEGSLYTWGWGVYGQLGHGNVEDMFQPKIVEFFENKNVLQVSLGHAHSLILCSPASNILTPTTLYTFGSNHYGQLGVGQYYELDNHTPDVRSLVPIEVFINKTIRLIHTKFFTNFIVTENNELLTWGSSPQALRMQYQARKRAKNLQKQEECNERTTDASIPQKLKDNMLDESLLKGDTPIYDINFSVESKMSMEKVSDENQFAEKQKCVNESEICKGKSESSNLEQHKKPKENVNKQTSFDEENPCHYYPTMVDLQSVTGIVTKISSGLYHHAFITETQTLYVWGKNLEKQLGVEKSQSEVTSPCPVNTVGPVIHVECGADFTLVMLNDYSVKAFGNNNNGQCGRDNAAEKPAAVGRLVRLRASKRVVRIPDQGQCFEAPVDVSLPRPKISMDFKRVRYLKRLPDFKKCYVQSSSVFNRKDIVKVDQPLQKPAMEWEENECNFIHYCLALFHGLYDSKNVLDTIDRKEFKTRILMLNYHIRDAFTICISETQNVAQSTIIFEYFTKDSSIVPIQRQDLKFFIYELFMHVINNGFPVLDVETFFLQNVDHYLFALAHVMFFNNNNSKLERKLYERYYCLFGGEIEAESFPEAFDKSEEIFKNCSIFFKTTICQRIINYDNLS